MDYNQQGFQPPYQAPGYGQPYQQTQAPYQQPQAYPQNYYPQQQAYYAPPPAYSYPQGYAQQPVVYQQPPVFVQTVPVYAAPAYPTPAPYNTMQPTGGFPAKPMGNQCYLCGGTGWKKPGKKCQRCYLKNGGTCWKCLGTGKRLKKFMMKDCKCLYYKSLR